MVSLAEFLERKKLQLKNIYENYIFFLNFRETVALVGLFLQQAILKGSGQ
jgi:hypothetical protein